MCVARGSDALSSLSGQARQPLSLSSTGAGSTRRPILLLPTPDCRSSAILPSHCRQQLARFRELAPESAARALGDEPPERARRRRHVAAAARCDPEIEEGPVARADRARPPFARRRAHPPRPANPRAPARGPPRPSLPRGSRRTDSSSCARPAAASPAWTSANPRFRRAVALAGSAAAAFSKLARAPAASPDSACATPTAFRASESFNVTVCATRSASADRPARTSSVARRSIARSRIAGFPVAAAARRPLLERLDRLAVRARPVERVREHPPDVESPGDARDELPARSDELGVVLSGREERRSRAAHPASRFRLSDRAIASRRRRERSQSDSRAKRAASRARGRPCPRESRRDG